MYVVYYFVIFDTNKYCAKICRLGYFVIHTTDLGVHMHRKCILFMNALKNPTILVVDLHFICTASYVKPIVAKTQRCIRIQNCVTSFVHNHTAHWTC